MHHLDLLRLGESQLDELRTDADHRRLLRRLRNHGDTEHGNT